MSDIAMKKVEKWKIEDVHPYELNAKKHDKKQVAKIVKSIQDFGWDQPIVVDKEGVVIKGHGRRLAAIELGLRHVPVVVRDDLSAELVNASRLADNRVAEGGYDVDLLQQDILNIDYDFSDIFDEKELSFMSEGLLDMDETVFVEVDDIMENHTLETAKKLEETKAGNVALAKAFGFKTIPKSAEVHIAKFIAIIKSKSGKSAEESLVTFAKQYVEGQS